MFNDLLVHFTGRLTGGWLNILVATHSWIVPTLQTIHILSVAVVLSGVALINLRIVGIVERGQPIAAVLDRFLWPVTLAVAVLAVTGILLIAGEPTRAIFRTIFWVKMALILLALALTWSHRPAFTLPAGGAIAAAAPGRKLLAIVALLLWLAVIVAGRWIAYVEAWPGAPA
jgi:hypothetical protein